MYWHCEYTLIAHPKHPTDTGHSVIPLSLFSPLCKMGIHQHPTWWYCNSESKLRKCYTWLMNVKYYCWYKLVTLSLFYQNEVSSERSEAWPGQYSSLHVLDYWADHTSSHRYISVFFSCKKKKEHISMPKSFHSGPFDDAALIHPRTLRSDLWDSGIPSEKE